ncbi:MAG: DUF86 domain-containing protein [Desulfobacteraceae bacterium]|nr:MAG: DUF86 domain-containing protein [Desulfobacteraceae bacterium]
MDKFKRQVIFIEESIAYFEKKIQGVNRDLYFADRDIRSILDKTINDLILCLVDIAEECLRKGKRVVADTYKDTILACYEFLGEIVIRVAPLVKHRNELVHQYLKVNWQNIATVKNKIPDIRAFVEESKFYVSSRAEETGQGDG